MRLRLVFPMMLGAIILSCQANFASAQALTDNAPDGEYGPLHAWYDVNQSLGLWEGRTDQYDDEWLVDVRDEAEGSGEPRGGSYGTNVETWAQFDDFGGDFWPERVGGFTGSQNGMTVWEIRNAAGWDDRGGWTDDDGIGTEGIGLDGGFSIVMALQIHEVTSYNGTWNVEPMGPNDDTPILNGSTSIFNEGPTDIEQTGKALLWMDAERDGYEGPVWVMDGGEELVAGPVTLGEWQVHTFVYDGGNSQHYIDGELAASGDAGEPLMSSLTLWSTDGGWHRAGGLDFAEGLFYDEVLSDGDRAGIEQYLAQKWAIGATTPGDFNGDGSVDAADMNLLLAHIDDNLNEAGFDLTGDGVVDGGDIADMAEQKLGSYIGDSNLDGEFGSADLVEVFIAGEYEDGIADNSTWQTGDWTGDREFDSTDFVAAFTGGGYELGPRAATSAVPEPSSWALLALGGLIAARLRRQRD